MPTSDRMLDAARQLLSARSALALAKEGYAAASTYYHAGHWKADDIPVEQVGPLVDQLKAALSDRQQALAVAEVALDRQISSVTPDPIGIRIMREQLLADSQQANWREPNHQPFNAFERWLAERTGKHVGLTTIRNDNRPR